jgi:hypothetical protein
MSEFIKIKARRRIVGIQSPDDTSTEAVDLLSQNLQAKITVIQESQLYKEIQRSFANIKLVKIRCVALGSPCQDEPALYQLALLKAIAEEYNITSGHISIYDPVFSSLDNQLFNNLGYRVEEAFDALDNDSCLYFLPHAPLDLTNAVLRQQPKFFLSNNVLSHTQRVLKSDLHEKYPLLSKLVHTLEKNTEHVVDDFQPIVKRKNRRQKNKFREPKIDYTAIESYFSEPTVVSFKEIEQGPWLNSFTDLAFHVIK